MSVILQYPFGRCTSDRHQKEPLWSAVSDLSDVDITAVPPSLIALHSRHFSLIPADYYDADAGQSYLTQLGMSPETPFAVNPVPEWNGQLVFSLEAWPKHSLPQQKIWSIWRGLFYAADLLSRTDPNPGVYMHVTPGQIYMVAFEGDTLQFFNTFPVRDIHDHLYFLLQGLEQWGKSPIHTPVFISGHLTVDSPLYTLMEGFIGNLSFVPEDLFPDSTTPQPQGNAQFFDLRSFVACVSSAEN